MMLSFHACKIAGFLWGTETIMTGCSSSHHQWLLSDSNTGAVGYKPCVLTIMPGLLHQQLQSAKLEQTLHRNEHNQLLLFVGALESRLFINSINECTTGLYLELF